MKSKKSSKWYGWIPTNRGKINFSFISYNNIKSISKNFKSKITSQKVTIEELDISMTSDSYKFSKYRKKDNNQEIFNEITSFANIIIENDDIFKGSIEIYNTQLEINSNFTIESNGKIEFYGYRSKKFEELIAFEKEVQTLMYIIIKTIVHGDSHHHQKIDIALPITVNNFDTKHIVETFVDYIKLVEKNVKNLKECHSNLRSETFAHEINGYISYLKTFLILFDKNENLQYNLKYAENILSSLKATIEKRKIKKSYALSLYTALFTFIGLFISVNILINGFWIQDSSDIVNYLSSNYSRFELLTYSFSIILFSFFFYISCTLKSLLYYHYYDGYELIYFIKDSNFSKLNYLGKAIKSIPLIFFIIFIYKELTIDNIFKLGFYIIDLVS